MNLAAIKHLKADQTESALESLKKAEALLEERTNEGMEVDRNMIIIILYNQACCYQRLSCLDDCANYLDGSIYNLEQKLQGFGDWDEDLARMLGQDQSDARDDSQMSDE